MTDSWFMIMDFYDISYIYIFLFIFLNEAVVQKPLFLTPETTLQHTESTNTADDDTLTHLVLVIFNCIFLRNKKHFYTKSF